MAFRASITVPLRDGRADEAHARFAIDIQAARPAPGGAAAVLDVYASGDPALCFDLLSRVQAAVRAASPGAMACADVEAQAIVRGTDELVASLALLEAEMAMLRRDVSAAKANPLGPGE